MCALLLTPPMDNTLSQAPVTIPFESGMLRAIGKPLEGHTDPIRFVAYSPPNENYMVSGSVVSTSRMWDAKTGAKVGKLLKGHADTVRSIAMNSALSLDRWTPQPMCVTHFHIFPSHFPLPLTHSTMNF
jgi:WD40 repeat protein